MSGKPYRGPYNHFKVRVWWVGVCMLCSLLHAIDSHRHYLTVIKQESLLTCFLLLIPGTEQWLANTFFQHPHLTSRNHFPFRNKDAEVDKQAAACQRMSPTENLQHLGVRNQECPFNSSLYVLPQTICRGDRVFYQEAQIWGFNYT